MPKQSDQKENTAASPAIEQRLDTRVLALRTAAAGATGVQAQQLLARATMLEEVLAEITTVSAQQEKKRGL